MNIQKWIQIKIFKLSKFALILRLGRTLCFTTLSRLIKHYTKYNVGMSLERAAAKISKIK